MSTVYYRFLQERANVRRKYFFRPRAVCLDLCTFVASYALDAAWTKSRPDLTRGALRRLVVTHPHEVRIATALHGQNAAILPTLAVRLHS